MTKFYCFIFMNIGNSISITCIVYNSCCICLVFIPHSKYFYLIILFRRISPFVLQISEFLVKHISSSIYSHLSICILMSHHFIHCLIEKYCFIITYSIQFLEQLIFSASKCFHSISLFQSI